MEQFDEQEIIQSHLATGEDLAPERFPQLSTLSSAFFYDFVPVAKEPELPEVVFVPTSEKTRLETIGTMASWNFLWEAAQYRKEAFENSRRADETPELARWINALPSTSLSHSRNSEQVRRLRPALALVAQKGGGPVWTATRQATTLA